MAERLCHINSLFAEILQVGTFAHWGRATHLPFSLKICKSKWQRGCATPFPFLLKICKSALFMLRLCHICAAKGIPCVFSSLKGTPHGSTWAKMRAKHEQHTRNMRVASDCTELRPFSPSTSILVYDPWHCYKMIKSMILRIDFNFEIWLFEHFSYYFEKAQFTVVSFGAPQYCKNPRPITCILSMTKNLSLLQFFNPKAHYMFS